MPRKLPCSVCGVERPAGASSLPAGLYTCHSCRRVNPVPYGRRDGTLVPTTAACLDCGSQFRPTRTRDAWTRCCSRRCDVSRRNREQRQRLGYIRNDNRTRRYARERAVIGLTRYQRDALRGRWKRAGRACFYCAERPCETVDHVVPLIRGGSNYEGNLVPACRPCNSSKRDLLLIEWRVAGAAELRLMRKSLHSTAA